MVWNIEIQRAAALLASVLFASVLLTGCVSDTSATQLDWAPAGDAIHHPRTAVNTPPRTPPARRHTAHRPPPVQTAADNCPPTPRARPAWYNASTTPPAAPPAATPAIQPPPSSGATPSFLWPVTGPVISDFGTNATGQRNDGINIATPYGTPIHAAASGTISYAGNELRGYGNLVLIKHDDGYVTAYAHAERIVVNRGDYVAKGQIIGYAGNTGDVTSPQLHFEIRRGVQPVNPRSMLLASRAS